MVTPRTLLLLIALAAGLFLKPGLSVRAADRIWTGDVNGNWSTAGNWQGGVAPKAGDVLRFPVVARRFVVTNQLALGFQAMSFEGNYTVTGSPLLTRYVSGGAFDDGPTHRSEIFNKLILQPDGGIFGTSRSQPLGLRGNVVLSGGINRLELGALTFDDVISGPGSLRITNATVEFRDTNTYQGLTVVESGMLVLRGGNGAKQGRLGSTTQPTHIRSGGALGLIGRLTVEEELLIAGEGAPRPRGLPIGEPYRFPGAVQVVEDSAARLTVPLVLSSNATVAVGAVLNRDNVTRLQVSDVIAGAEFPAAHLTKIGQGRLILASLSNHIDVPLNVQEGALVLVDPEGVSPPPRGFFAPNIRGALTVGTINDGPSPPTADLFLPYNLRPDQPPPTPVLADDVAVFVGFRSTVTFGPMQRGLGNPLRLHAGTVRLLNLSGPRAGEATGWQGGLIEVNGATVNSRSISRITGVFGVDGQLTIRSLNPRTTLRFEEGYVVGGELTLEGGTNVFAGVANNQLTNLVVLHGTVIAEQPKVAFARTNVVGTAGAASETALLTVTLGNQFPPGGRLEVRRSGRVQFRSHGLNALDSLELRGGELTVRRLTVQGANFAADSVLELYAASMDEVPLTVSGAWTWSGPVAAKVNLPDNAPSGSTCTLIQRAGTAPIPGEFVGLPDGGTVRIGAKEFRLNYTGGDGNDLVAQVVSSPPAPPLLFTMATDGVLTLRWTALSQCQLQYRSALGSGPDWLNLSPTASGEFGLLEYLVSPETTGGYYRLACP